MKDLVFHPIIPISTMSIFIFVMLVLVLINRKHIINRILILAVFLIITQRPMLVNQEDIVYGLDLDVIFVIDTSISMGANDANGTRLDLAKKLSKKIIEELPGSRLAVISHDNTAYVRYPFTFDSDDVVNVIDNLKIVEPNYAAGSSITMPADYLNMMLNSTMILDKDHSTNRYKIVFFMEDGGVNTEAIKNNLTREEKLELSKAGGTTAALLDISLKKYNGLSELIEDGAVIGIGSSTGGTIKIDNSINMNNIADSEGYIIDSTTKKRLISKIDENNLKKLSEKLDLDYFNANSNQLDKKITEIKNKSQQIISTEKIKKEADLYYYFAFVLMILFLYELFYYRRNQL